MIEYVKRILPSISSFSNTLNLRAILIDQPWVNIDSEGNYQKLIFKNNKELILSQNGIAEIGKWDYFPSSNSLLIDRNIDKILLKQGFVDKGLLVLKYDGFSNDLFVLTNENIIPDLNIESYIKSIIDKRLNIVSLELNSGECLNIIRNKINSPIGIIGQKVLLNHLKVHDGTYTTLSSKITYYVKDEQIVKTSTVSKKSINNGIELEITIFNKFNFETPANYQYGGGDIVKIDGEVAPDGVYRTGFFKTIEIINGKIC